MALPYKELFQPIKIGSCEIKNRFAMAPMGPLGLADAEGGFNIDLQEFSHFKTCLAHESERISPAVLCQEEDR